MKLETLLQLMYTNGHDSLVSRAVQIDNNIPMPFAAGDLISLEINRDKLPAGKRFKSDNRHDEYWGTVNLTVQAVNPYSMTAPYLVTMPNGRTEWVDGKPATTERELIDEEQLAAVEH